MNYKVQFTEQAETEANQIYEWICKESPANAIRWFNRLVDTIETLESFPERCAVAPEGEVVHREIRQLLHGKYRILFIIHSENVFILHIRHGAQQRLPPNEI